MEQFDLRAYLISTLERLGLEYFVTGSVAAMYYGEPRFTNDIDVVVILSEESIAKFCAQFPSPEFYVSEEAAKQAARNRTQFNIIHPDSGLKVDVIISSNSAFDRSRMSRKQRVLVDKAHEAFFASPEDVILKKMLYYQEGGSEKHIRDITGILKLTGDRIDAKYVRDWAAQLGLTNTWETIVKVVKPQE